MSSPARPFPWSDKYKLGYERMDETHRDFVEKVNALLVAADDAVLARLDEFVEHAEAHFGEEKDWMKSTAFPAADCHIDEHEAVMKSVREVRDLLAREPNERALKAVRSLSAELMRWFPGHADYLDSALSHWMCKRIYGGTPVVLRRS